MDWSLEIGRTLFRYRGIPKNAAKLFFASDNFQKLITFSFLNIFQKIQKEVLEEIRGHLTYIGDFSILLFSGQKNLKSEIMLHDFTFQNFLTRKRQKSKNCQCRLDAHGSLLTPPFGIFEKC